MRRFVRTLSAGKSLLPVGGLDAALEVRGRESDIAPAYVKGRVLSTDRKKGDVSALGPG